MPSHVSVSPDGSDKRRTSLRILSSVDEDVVRPTYPDSCKSSSNTDVKRSMSSADARVGSSSGIAAASALRESSYRQIATAWPRFIDPCSSRAGMRSAQWQKLRSLLD